MEFEIVDNLAESLHELQIKDPVIYLEAKEYYPLYHRLNDLVKLRTSIKVEPAQDFGVDEIRITTQRGFVTFKRKPGVPNND